MPAKLPKFNTKGELESGEPIILYAAGARVELDRVGAYVTGLTLIDPGNDFFETDLLFRKQVINGKTRGGMHLCLPNFGPDVTGCLPQHGFAREALWFQDGAVTEGRARLSLDIAGAEPDYAGLSTAVEVSIDADEDETRLRTLLLTTNNGSTTMRVAPALHPYFALDGISATDVAINDRTFTEQELAAAQTFSISDTVAINIPNRPVIMQTDGYQQLTVWTDSPDDYICVEPSATGPSFLREHGDPQEYLPMHAHKMYDMLLRFPKILN